MYRLSWKTSIRLRGFVVFRRLGLHRLMPVIGLQHMPPHLKGVSYPLYKADAFKRYCAGETVSVAHRQQHIVCEKAQWEAKCRREREERGEVEGEDGWAGAEGDDGEEEEDEEGLQGDGNDEADAGEAAGDGNDGADAGEATGGRYDGSEDGDVPADSHGEGETEPELDDDIDWEEGSEEEEAAMYAAAVAALAAVMAGTAVLLRRRGLY